MQAVALAVADELRRTRTEVEKTLNKITQLESVLNRQSAVTASTIQFAALKNVRSCFLVTSIFLVLINVLYPFKPHITNICVSLRNIFD